MLRKFFGSYRISNEAEDGLPVAQAGPESASKLRAAGTRPQAFHQLFQGDKTKLRSDSSVTDSYWK